ncbi:MAG TPA: hypothetical protein VLN26_01580 [Gaiellaceae bacterium]|nr:hypothetical protein [Gaiellaceae bacterium]
MWHVLVDVGTSEPLPAEKLAAVLETHPLILAVSVNAPAPPPGGWRKTLAALGRARPASVLVGVEAEERGEAERIACAAVEEALARLGVEARLRASAFRR